MNYIISYFQSHRIVGNNLVATTFHKSVPMVTYLACFIVSEFSYKENTTKRGTPVSKTSLL